MKTYNYDIELMLPMQADKEITFNEAQNIIDSFCNSTTEDFVEIAPSLPILGKKYIITSGEQKNQICFCAAGNLTWQYLMPKDGMLMFVKSANSFYIFSKDSWQLTNGSLNQKESYNFIGINDQYILDEFSEITYLYIQGDCEIDFSKVIAKNFTIIIKQHVENIYQLTWPNNILWPAKTPVQLSQSSNAIDIFKFYHLPETDKFLAVVINQNYTF